jgi:peptidyl-prolyl cis-trans isomerase A (cyclophilin A)
MMSIRRLVVLALTVGASACALAGGGRPRLDPSIAVPDSFLVAFETSRGRFDVMARTQWSPAGVDRFYQLVATRYYDNSGFFRVVKDFVAQWGLAADPAVTRAWRVRRLADEPVRHSNSRGTLAYARGGAGTRTTQVYINLVDNARLDTLNGFGFPPFAEVVSGMSVVDSLYWQYSPPRNPPPGGPPPPPGPSQDSITMHGTPYLLRHFPKLDYIKTARVVQEWRKP